MRIQLVISGRNYDMAQALPGELTLAEGAGVDAALEAVRALLPPGARLPESCLVAVSGVHLGTVGSHPPHALRDGDELLVLAPVAGG